MHISLVKALFMFVDITSSVRRRNRNSIIFQPDNWLIWRQVATISQGLSLCGPEDIPKGDSNSRLQIHVRNPNVCVCMF